MADRLDRKDRLDHRADHVTERVTEVEDFFFSRYITAQERRWSDTIEDGLAHCSRILPADPDPDAPVTLLFANDASLPIDRVAVYYTTDGAEPLGEHGVARVGMVTLAEPQGVEHDAATDCDVRHWRATLPPQPEGTLVRYRAEGWSTTAPRLLAGRWQTWQADEGDPISPPAPGGRVFAYSVDRFRPPEWLADAVIYHVFVDRFSTAPGETSLQPTGNITDIFGGTLHGVRERLDYIQALGANCLWLSPVFESPTHHGYDVTNYHHVARRLGGDEALRALMQAAHARGMRVLLDFVPNHTSYLHPAFVEARANPDSPYFSWYSIGDWPPYGYRSFYGAPSMPQLATDQPEAQRYLISAALHWLREFGVDGFRLDHVGGPSHAFWAILHRAIKERFPEAATLGEISEPYEGIASYAGRMDGFMDFPLTGVMRRVFGQRAAPLAELLGALDARRDQLPRDMAPALLLNNHDMHRFLWIADGDKARLRLASACQMTLPGTPIIYYGTEVGLSQDGDAHVENAYARAPMPWGEAQDRVLLEHYQRLLTLRASHPALRRGELIGLPVVLEAKRADDVRSADVRTAQVGAYLRTLGKERLLVALNNNQSPVSVCVALDEAREAHELLGAIPAGSVRLEAGTLRLALPPLGAAVVALA